MNRRLWATMGVASAFVVATAGPSLAEGDEELGPPSIDIAEGTGIAAGGVGLFDSGAGDIEVTVPDGATVNQVLLYWEGHLDEGESPDDTISVGDAEVTGTPLASAPQHFYPMAGSEVSSAGFRADITDLGVVAAGANTLSVSGLEFPRNDDNASNGAGVVVIYDDGSGATTVDLRDGVDTAFSLAEGEFPPPRDTTVPQEFTFEAADVERIATFTAFASSVFDGDGEGVRPNALEITVGDAEPEIVENPFTSADGGEWDTVQLERTIPAGVDSVTVQALSVHDDEGNRPASLVWTMGALLVSPADEPAPTTTTTVPSTTTTAGETTTTPSTTVTTAPPTTEPAPSTTEPAPPTTEPVADEGELPRTGNDTLPLVAAGVGLLLVGGAVTLGVRRFRSA